MFPSRVVCVRTELCCAERRYGGRCAAVPYSVARRLSSVAARRRRPGESGGPASGRPPLTCLPLSPPPHAGLATCAPCTPPLSPHSREPCATSLASPDSSTSRSLEPARTSPVSLPDFRHVLVELWKFPRISRWVVQSKGTSRVGGARGRREIGGRPRMRSWASSARPRGGRRHAVPAAARVRVLRAVQLLPAAARAAPRAPPTAPAAASPVAPRPPAPSPRPPAR